MAIKILTLSLFLLATISIGLISNSYCQTPGTQITPTFKNGALKIVVESKKDGAKN
jgi:hypothetical protein